MSNVNLIDQILFPLPLFMRNPLSIFAFIVAIQIGFTLWKFPIFVPIITLFGNVFIFILLQCLSSTDACPSIAWMLVVFMILITTVISIQYHINNKGINSNILGKNLFTLID